jgi:hypothetical protein
LSVHQGIFVPARDQHIPTLSKRHGIDVEIMLAFDSVFKRESEPIEQLHYTICSQSCDVKVILQKHQSSDVSSRCSRALRVKLTGYDALAGTGMCGGCGGSSRQ